MKNWKIGARLMALAGVLSLALLIVGLLGLHGMSNSIAGLRAVYEDSTLPLFDLEEINKLNKVNTSEMLRGMLHAPGSPYAALHDHPITVHTERIEESLAKIEKLWASYGASSMSPEEKALVDKFIQSRQEYNQIILMPVLQALKNQDFASPAFTTFTASGLQYGQAMEQNLENLIISQTREAQQGFTQANALYAWQRAVSIGAIVGGLVLGFWLAYAIIRSVTLPLREAVGASQKIANGDLSHEIRVNGKDETAELLQALATMQAHLRTMLAEIHNDADQLLSASTQLSSTTAHVAASTGEQSEAASAMAAAVEEMTASVNQVADLAHETKTISSHSGELSAQGSEVIHRAVVEMNKISSSVASSSDIIRQLEQQSNEISAIVNVIKEIADQTNLLALNAAIEAARAGEQGRGFAVVADEVRKLAERTGKSTQEISEMIGKIQAGTRNAVDSMEAGVIQVKEGVNLANQAGSAITEINSGAERVVHMVSEISAALREQSTASNDISQNVERIAHMVEENSAAVNETADAAHNLESLASSLQNAVGRFRM